MIMDVTVEKYKKISRSTNLRAAELADGGAAEGSYVFAEAQEGGRGRLGRSWQSEEPGNMALSLILRPALSAESVSILTLAAAVALKRAVAELTGRECFIKWPNDIILGGTKLSGILTELKLSEDGPRYVIVGVGVNVNRKKFPEEIEKKATSLFLETGKTWNPEELSQLFVKEMLDISRKIYKDGSLAGIKDEYERALISLNREIILLPDGESGICRGITKLGALLTEIDGEIREINAGEISVRVPGGYV